MRVSGHEWHRGRSKIKTFYSDVRMEMKKVTTPSFKEVQATTIVVIITVFIFGVYFWLVDFLIGRGHRLRVPLLGP